MTRSAQPPEPVRSALMHSAKPLPANNNEGAPRRPHHRRRRPLANLRCNLEKSAGRAGRERRAGCAARGGGGGRRGGAGALWSPRARLGQGGARAFGGSSPAPGGW
jgi:hypothetical protein